MRATGFVCACLAVLGFAGEGIGQEVQWPDLSRPLPDAQAGGGKDAAVIVAVERYAELPGIDGALQNGNDWHGWLTGTRKVPADHVALLRDNEGTIEKMKRFAERAASQVQPGGTLWFVFIGHGAPAHDGKDGLLVGYDAQQDADSLYSRSLLQRELLSILQTGKQARTVVLLDACFSGRAPNGKPLIAGLQPLVVVNTALTQKALGTTLLLTAAKASQFAGPLPGARRPAFSYLALGGLRGWADGDNDGRVTARELRNYTNKMLVSLVKDRNQEPELLANRPDEVLATARERGPDLAALERNHPAAAAATPRHEELFTVAVSEFQAQGFAPDQQWIGRSFSEGLVGRLARARTVRVVERQYLDQVMAELKLQHGTQFDAASAARVGRLLGARIFVFGSVSALGDQVVARARTVSVERGEVLDSAEAAGESRGLLAMQAEVARQIAGALSIEQALMVGSTPELDTLTVATLGELERLRAEARGLPFYGQDAARARRRGEYQLALAACDRLTQLHPRLAEAHWLRALFSVQVDDLDAADTESRLLQQLGGESADAMLLRANVAHLRGDDRRALFAVIEAIRKYPDDSRPWYVSARLRTALGDRANAAGDLVEAAQRGPELSEVEPNLQALLSPAEGPSLIAWLTQARPALALGAAAFSVHFRDAWGEAPPLVERVTSALPRLYIGHYLRGALAARDGRVAEAMAGLQYALSLRPTSPEVHRELGRLLLAQHDCWYGAQHVALYLHTAKFVADYAALEHAIQTCAPQ